MCMSTRQKINMWFLILCVMCIGFVGAAVAAVNQVSTNGANLGEAWIPVTIAGALVVQAIAIGIWVGTTRTTVKNIQKSVDSIGKKLDKNKDCLDNLTSEQTTHSSRIDTNKEEIDKLRVNQESCKFSKEEPRDFVRKNGRT